MKRALDEALQQSAIPLRDLPPTEEVLVASLSESCRSRPAQMGPGCVKTLLRIRWISFAAQDAYIAFSADQCGYRDVAIGSAIRSEGWRKDLAAVAGSEARSHSHGDRLHQWCDPHDSHHPLQVVREHVQTHLSTDVLKRACQEVRVTHP